MIPNKAIRLCRVFLALTAVFAGIGQPLFAQLNSDENSATVQPFQWDADGELSMSIADNIRTINLNDNVVLFQGSLEIHGDTAVITFDVPTGEFIKATVFGAPVSYTQELNQNGSIVNGTSDSIIFYTDESTGDETVELNGNAHIESPDSTISCVAIVYLPSLDLIPNTTGPCAGSFNQ